MIGGVLAGVIAASTATVSASGHREIPPGEWEGVISFFGDTGTARGDFEGSFRLQVADGGAGGDFDWQGIVNTDAAGDVAVSIVGEISGAADSPLFVLTGGTSGGIAIPDPTGQGNIVLTAVTCESIEGTAQNITTAAQISEIEWFAVRAGAPIAAGTFFDDLTTLRLETTMLLGEIGRSPTADLVATINDLAGTAEVLLAELERTPECQAFHFRSLIASQVERLLAEVLADRSLADAATFADLVILGLRAGAWGPGAADVGAIDLEVAIIAEIEARVDEALAAGDEAELLELAWLAYLLGLESIEARIIGGGP